MSKIYHIPLTTFVEFGVHRSPCSSSRWPCRSWWAWPAKYRPGMPAFHAPVLRGAPGSRNKRAPECAYTGSNNNWKNWKQRYWGKVISWIANAKNKTLALTVHTVRADVGDVALVQARRRALSFDGTVEAAQSSSGLGVRRGFLQEFLQQIGSHVSCRLPSSRLVRFG
jgi:hypothetical protein